MSDPIVNKWQQKGIIQLWRTRIENENFRDYHLCADPEGCDSLLELLDLMEKARWSCKGSIIIPTDKNAFEKFPANSIKEKWKYLHTLVFLYTCDQMPPDHWSLTEEQSRITFSFGKN